MEHLQVRTFNSELIYRELVKSVSPQVPKH
jgi:hypothetical protein